MKNEINIFEFNNLENFFFIYLMILIVKEKGYKRDILVFEGFLNVYMGIRRICLKSFIKMVERTSFILLFNNYVCDVFV